MCLHPRAVASSVEDEGAFEGSAGAILRLFLSRRRIHCFNASIMQQLICLESDHGTHLAQVDNDEEHNLEQFC